MAHAGQRIRDLRLQHGMTQGKLAELVGVKQAAISLIESSDRWPSLKMLARLASIFNVPVSELAPTLEEINEKEEAVEVAK